MAQFYFTDGSRYAADAQLVGEEIQAAMDDRDGRIDTAALVEFASDPSKEIHKCFTWDNDEAAHKYRLGEARKLIRSVRIVVAEDQPSRPLAVNVRVQDAQHYATPDRLKRNPDERAAAVRDAMNRLDASQRSLTELQELLGEGQGRDRAARGARLVQRAREHVGGIQINP